jgi:hypothetical protein
VAGRPCGCGRRFETIRIFLRQREEAMNSVIYLIGLIVVVLAILSFLGLR